MRFASPRKTCPHWPPLWQRRALSGGMKRAPQASFRARGSPLAPWAGFLAKMKPISLADCYAASYFYITAWKWNAAAFSSRAAFFWNIAWARCFARQSAMRAKKAAPPFAPPWARRGFSFTGGLWGILGRNFRHFPPPAGRTFTGCFPGGFARWASSRTHWAAISTACFSPKSFDASLHKAARGIRPLWMPRAAFSLKGNCAVRFAGRQTGFLLCLSVLCAQGPPCAFPAYFCKPAACAAGFFHFSAPRESCCPAAETIAFTSAIVLPSARRRRSRRMRSTLWARR